MKNILLMTIFLGLTMIGLAACGESANSLPPEDQIIDKKAFLKVYAECDARVGSEKRMECVLQVFKRKTDDYCTDNEVSHISPQCSELQKKVQEKIRGYVAEQVREAFKGLG